MPYIGELRLFAGSFAPAGWMLCQGQQLAIAEYDTLFNLIGTTYGGDGQETFNLPDLQGRVPIHMGNLSGTTFTMGERAGVETVTLTTAQLPIHSHAFLGTNNLATQTPPSATVTLATSTEATVFPYGGDAPLVTLLPDTISTVGGSQPHENRQPVTAINYIISLFGVFPSQG